MISNSNFYPTEQFVRYRNGHADIDFGAIKRYILRNWLNLAILTLAVYAILNKNINFSIGVGDSAALVSALPKDQSAKNKNAKNVKQNMANFGETRDHNDDGVVEVLPVRNVKPVQSAYAKAGPEANLFDNVSIFMQPEKATPSVVKSKQEKCWDYIRRFVTIAKAERDKFGIPVSITLAQGLLESDAGESRLTRAANNHFGIKTFSSRVPHVVMKDDRPNDKFRKYGSAWESFRDHSLLLMKAHYNHLQYLSKNDYVGWAKGLQKAGYATDKAYAEKLIKIIENLRLYQFDEV